MLIQAAKAYRIIWPMRAQGDGWYLVLTSKSLMKPEVEDYGLELPTWKPIESLKIMGWNSQHESQSNSWRLWVGTPNMKANWSVEDYGLELPTWKPIEALKITGWNSQHESQSKRWRLRVGINNMKANWSIEDYGLEVPTWKPIEALKIMRWNSQHESQKLGQKKTKEKETR